MMEDMASEAYRRVYTGLISKSFESKYLFKFNDMLTDLRALTDIQNKEIPYDIELAIVTFSQLF